MKLIIDIPEEIMECIKNNGCLSVIYNDEVAKAIINGTPYNPSGDCISRSALKEAIDKDAEDICGFEDVIDYIDNAPTVEQFDDTELQRAIGYADGYSKGREERPQGEWIMFKDVQNVIKPILKRFYGASDSDIEYIIQEIEQKAYLEGGTE